MRKLLALMLVMLSMVAGYALAADGAMDPGTETKVMQEIERYLAADAKLKKSFLLIDPRTDRVLRLALDHVHDGVMAHGSGYAACADFKDKAGKVYDVDLVVEIENDQAQVREIYLHMADGKQVPRDKGAAK
jgi:hypothetical protein